MKVLYISLFLTLAAGLSPAQAFQSASKPNGDDAILKNNPTYSAARLGHHQTPEQWLSEQENGLADAKTEFARFLLLAGTAQAALETGENDKAEKYARQALQLVDKFNEPTRFLPNGHPYSRVAGAVFGANLVLGRLALLRADIEAAKQYLLDAGKTPGDASLDIAGPNMSLARELLKVSEKDTVLQFLDECRLFWKEDNGRIARWTADIQAGTLPEFGLNLVR